MYSQSKPRGSEIPVHEHWDVTKSICVEEVCTPHPPWENLKENRGMAREDGGKKV